MKHPDETCLWLIRHAEVEQAYHTIFGGRINMGLSPRGHEQAAALARYLQRRKFAAVYASPMKRVSQTLAPVLGDGLPDPVLLDDLREVDFGDWTGLTWEEVQLRFGFPASAWLDQIECAGIRNGECGADLRARIGPCVEQMISSHPGQQVAVFCHGGVIRVIVSILMELPLPRMGAVEIEYASISKVAVRPTGPRLELVNFTPWRDIHT